LLIDFGFDFVFEQKRNSYGKANEQNQENGYANGNSFDDFSHNCKNCLFKVWICGLNLVIFTEKIAKPLPKIKSGGLVVQI
jgi:hypothetical protein